MFDLFFNSAFGPLVAMGPLYTIAGVSVIISLISAILYRVLIHRQTFHRIKSEQKELQERMKKAQKSGDEKALKDLFSSSMNIQNRMMVLTIKPMIAAMVVYFVLLPWLSGNYGDIAVKLVDGKGTIKYGGISGEVRAMGFNGETQFTFPKHAAAYSSGDKLEFAGKTWLVQYNEGKNELILQNVKFNLPFYFPLVGTQVGWLGLYIIISLPATMLFRKLLGVD